MASSKRQTTFAKMQREMAVKEKRRLKQEKKDEKKLAAVQVDADAEPGAVDPAPTSD